MVDLDHACKFKIKCESSDYKFRRCIEAGVTPEGSVESIENRVNHDRDDDYCMASNWNNESVPIDDSTDSTVTSKTTKCSHEMVRTPIEETACEYGMPENENDDDNICFGYVSLNSRAECSSQMENRQTEQNSTDESCDFHGSINVNRNNSSAEALLKSLMLLEESGSNGY